MTAVRRFLVPEVIQSSMMDCGPASLKALLEGFGIGVGYGRLREACSTDVDGTSIDTLEDVAIELGLEAEQVMVPVDHLLSAGSEATPSILVLQKPHTPAHFIVVWRVHGGLVQIMDPAVGRRWISTAALLRDVYVHRMDVGADDWRAWAESDSFQRPLLERLIEVGLDANAARAAIARAANDPTWRSLGTLDAATRMLKRLAKNGAFESRADIPKLLDRLTAEGPDSVSIPDGFWSVRQAEPDADGTERVENRGAVLVRAVRKAGPGERPATKTSVELSPELLESLKRPTATVWTPFSTTLRQAGLTMGAIVAIALVVSAATVLAQALLMRSLLDLGYWLGIAEHRLGAIVALSIFLTAVLALDVPISLAISRLGRRLEVFLRVAFSRKIPRIADQYFHSRLLSDMAERMHSIVLVRSLPGLVAEWLRSAFLLLFTSAGILWLAPWLTGWVIATLVIAPVLSLVSVSLLQEPEMRARSHAGTLIKFYLEALLGIATIRAHDAGRALMRQQESVLVQWNDASQRVQVGAVVFEVLQSIVGMVLAVGLVITHVGHAGTTGSILLIAYWGLQLPALAQRMAVSARQVAPVRNMLVRLLELLDAPEESAAEDEPSEGARPPAAPSSPVEHDNAVRADSPTPAEQDEPTLVRLTRPKGELPTLHRRMGARVELVGVSVKAGGHSVLEDVTLTIEPGSEVAIVGASGAGKSTLVGLLLGWHRPSAGAIRLDGEPLGPHELARWRRRTAWLDPTVQIFNRRLVQNLLYGSEESVSDLGQAIEHADLRDVLERMPEGLQTLMGEGGALVSGGEAQRVRLGRSSLRRDARLVLLDEPFRGLDRDKRLLLMERVRRASAGATLLCVTHDVSHTLAFPRVLVIDGGRVVEDGDPRALACDLSSKYQAMLAGEQFVGESVWSSPSWRRFRIENGTVTEQRRPAFIDVPQLVSVDEEHDTESLVVSDASPGSNDD